MGVRERGTPLCISRWRFETIVSKGLHRITREVLPQQGPAGLAQVLGVDRPFAFCGARRGAGPSLVIDRQLLEGRCSFSLRLRQCCCRDLRGRFCQVLHQCAVRALLDNRGRARGRRRPVGARSCLSPVSGAARGAGASRALGSRPGPAPRGGLASVPSNWLQSCPSASAASRGCPAAKV